MAQRRFDPTGCRVRRRGSMRAPRSTTGCRLAAAARRSALPRRPRPRTGRSAPALGIAHEAERGAGVECKHEAEEARDDLLLAWTKVCFDQRASLPDRSPPPRCSPAPTATTRVARSSCASPAQAKLRGSPAPNRFATQRPQSIGMPHVVADVGAPVPAAFALRPAALGLTATTSASPRSTLAAEVMNTKRRSLPSEASAA